MVGDTIEWDDGDLRCLRFAIAAMERTPKNASQRTMLDAAPDASVPAPAQPAPSVESSGGSTRPATK